MMNKKSIQIFFVHLYCFLKIHNILNFFYKYIYICILNIYIY